MNEFSDYEKEIIRKLISADSNRKTWEWYIGIPVLSFISDTFSAAGIYTSIDDKDEDKIIFEYSNLDKNIYDTQNRMLNSQRRVIYIFNLINKLKLKNYIVCINLDAQSKKTVIENLPHYVLIEEKPKSRIEFTTSQIQESFSDCMYQAIIVTEDLKVLVNNNFKTTEQKQFETELDKVQKTLFWTRCAFVIAFIATLLTVIDQSIGWFSNDDITLTEIKKTIEEKELPSIIKVEVINDTLTTKPIIPINRKVVPIKTSNKK